MPLADAKFHFWFSGPARVLVACPAGSEHLQRGPGNCDLGEASTSTPCRTGKRGLKKV